MAVTPASPPAGVHSVTGRTSVRRPRVLFLGKTYAGWQTRFLNLQASMTTDERIEPEFRAVHGWRPGGAIERIPAVGPAVKGRARATLEAAAFARLPRPDVIWSSAGEVLFPYLWAQVGRLRRPLVLEVDWTIEQQEAMAPAYFGRQPRAGAALAFAKWRERMVWRSASAFIAMSNWAAESLIRQGVPAERVHVIHPGLDVEWWSPDRQARQEAPVRLLFVGGDFDRKGGRELLAVFGRRFAGPCELDIVTHAAVEPQPRVRVHRLGPNTPELRALYRAADLLVLPTKADCFGHVAVEAMACGTPVLMTDIGGAPDIIVPGETGWLMESPAELEAALERAVEAPEQLWRMGEAARERAERLFDGRANDARLADLILQLAGTPAAVGGVPS